MEDKIQKRTLLKVFGIRFDIIVHSLVSNMFVYLKYAFLTGRIIQRSWYDSALHRHENLISSLPSQPSALEWEFLEWYVES